MKNFLLSILLIPLFSFAQGSSLGISKSSIVKQVISDDRLVYDKSYNNYSESYVRAVTSDNQIVMLYEISSNKVIKESLIYYNTSKETWARISIGLEDEDGWLRHSIKNEGGNYATRFNKGNKKIFLAYSPDDKVLGIITTMGNY